MAANSELLLYQTVDGNTRIEVLLDNDTVWLSQAQIGELFQKAKSTISEHITNIFTENELDEDSVVRKNRTTASDGKNYETAFYNLDVIISVGYRVKSLRGTQFRIWATQRLREYIVKGFTLDDQRLKEGGYRNEYFEELLERVRDIRTSEKNFYYKVREIYATSIDYDPKSDITQDFFATAQNKFHWAIHHHTAAELVAERVDASLPNMGLSSFKGDRVRKTDITVAKNYLNENELKQLNLLVDQFLSFAESQAMQGKPMYMRDWIMKLHQILTINDREILLDLGKVSHSKAEKIAEREYEKYKKIQDSLEIANIKKLEVEIKQVTTPKSKSSRKRG
ncbi:MAG: virulence RhuM family protein [Ignavibacteriota bacterium]